MWIVYKTTNLVNNKIYVGVHKQVTDSFDGYLGSGKWFRRSVKFHGRYNFIRETLSIHSSMDSAYSEERIIVNEDFLDSGNSYNLRLGGKGGWDVVNKSSYYKEKSKARRLELYGTLMPNCHSTEAKNKRRITNEKKYGNVMGQCHTPEARLKIKSTVDSIYGGIKNILHTEESLSKSKLSKSRNGTDQCLHLNSGPKSKEIRLKSVETRRSKGHFNNMKMHSIDKSKISYSRYSLSGLLLGDFINDRNAEKISGIPRSSIKSNNDPISIWVPKGSSFESKMEMKLINPYKLEYENNNLIRIFKSKLQFTKFYNKVKKCND